jgi:hypothetical protein
MWGAQNGFFLKIRQLMTSRLESRTIDGGFHGTFPAKLQVEQHGVRRVNLCVVDPHDMLLVE